MASNVGSRAFQMERLRKQFRKEAPHLMQAAVSAYRGGKAADAATLCRRIIEVLPDSFDALHLLGVVELEGGNFDEAARILSRAVDANPRSAEAYSNLGLALFNLQRFEEACRFQEKAIALSPNFATARTNLGNTLMRLKRLEQAIQAHDEALRIKPDYSDAHVNRGMALLLLDRDEEADQDFDRALALRPRHLQAMVGKGLVSLNHRHLDAALAYFDAALAVSPTAEVLAHRGRLYTQTKQLAKAETDFDAALAIDAKLEIAWRGKAQVAVLLGDVAQATAACNKVLASNPNCEIATLLLANCYIRQGDLQAGIAHLDRALAIKPDFEEAISKKIFTIDFTDVDFAAHQAVRKSWWEAIGVKVPRRQLRPRNLDSERRIVIGYVSSDFRNHSASLTFKPLLRHYDRANFEVVCYSCSAVRDAVTDECRSMVDRWVDASQLSDRELADRIEADGVDILVDLSGHSEGNRLIVFAAKPAPIQLTAWGHVTGTGLPTMDYMFADAVLIPQDVRHLFAEKIHDLPALITIEPPPEVQSSQLPMLRNGYVTFGVFNRIEKISDGVLAVWSRLLQAVAGSVIVVKHGALSDAFMRDSLVSRFEAHGIARDRVRCLGSTSREEHLVELSNIDISLDPFPQNGGVSTWESLQVGVPVVAKLGACCASRISGSIVSAIGLDDWVAEDDERYIAIAREFAARPSELATLRAKLPSMVANSEAGNTELYTRRVEEAYRRFWRDYCSST
ncbi:MAG: tetratricopeptide repeat protein [Bradyrhizobium sp.]|nr:tetratricopeptide repeat protein [Bradyrhizobium sp.]